MPQSKACSVVRVPARDLEDGAAPGGAATGGRAIEVAIAGLNEAGEREAALGAAVEGMQRGEAAGGRDLEDAAAPGGAATAGRAIEVAIAGLDDAGLRGAALGAAVEGMQRGERAGGVSLKTVPPPAMPPVQVVP